MPTKTRTTRPAPVGPSKVTEATNALLSLWESGNLPAALGRIAIRKQAGDGVPSDGWSFGNQLLQFLAGTEDGRTYEAWKQVGRQVKRKEEGGNAFYILAPCMVSGTRKNPVTGLDEKYHFVKGFKVTPRFRFEDTTGADLPGRPDYSPPELPPLSEVAEAWGIEVRYTETVSKGAWGYVTSGGRTITLGTHDTQVFFHELAHKAHEKVIGKPLVGGQDPHQEIVAETVAAVLANLHGIEGNIDSAREYVASYAKVDPEQVTKELHRHLSTIEKVLTLILSTAAGLDPAAAETSEEVAA